MAYDNELDAEIERCENLVKMYNELPMGAGRFGSILIQGIIDEAKSCRDKGDIEGQIRMYLELKECE